MAGKRRKRNIFAGADDVYLTSKHIAVRTVSTRYTKAGKRIFTDKTKYHKRTQKNMTLLKNTLGRVRFGRN